MSDVTRPTIALRVRTWPASAVADGPDGYRAQVGLRASYVYQGQTVLAPRWHNGSVTHWERAEVVKITVTFKGDGLDTAEPWFIVRFADGRENGMFGYSLADAGIPNLS